MSILNENPINRTRQQWADRISLAYGATVSAIIKVGAELIAAKLSLPHGQFGEMVRKDLPFHERTAQRFMQIAGNSVLANPTHVSHLPSNYSTLAILASWPDDELRDAIARGVIHPDVERDEICRARDIHNKKQAIEIIPDNNQADSNGMSQEARNQATALSSLLGATMAYSEGLEQTYKPKKLHTVSQPVLGSNPFSQSIEDAEPKEAPAPAPAQAMINGIPFDEFIEQKEKLYELFKLFTERHGKYHAAAVLFNIVQKLELDLSEFDLSEFYNPVDLDEEEL